MPNMRKDSIAIINANIVNEGSIFQGDLLIKGGRIIKVEPSIHIPEGTQVIDAKGNTSCLASLTTKCTSESLD